MEWIKCKWTTIEDKNGNVIGEEPNFKLPEDGEDILVTIEGKKRFVQADVAIIDGDGLYLEGRGEWDDVIAWMPMPEPYKENEEKASILQPVMHGKWQTDYIGDGFIQCPFCRIATNCEGNLNELHYCWNCGAKLE